MAQRSQLESPYPHRRSPVDVKIGFRQDWIDIGRLDILELSRLNTFSSADFTPSYQVQSHQVQVWQIE